uniref:Gustatory receptor n=1 Tax=Lutzomyia longipalpis TaxID=7200 RepID=A0A3F2ZD96_LUTLO
MTFTTALGIPFSFQKYTTIPNYSEKSHLKSYNIFLRMLPFTFCIALLIFEFVDTKFFFYAQPFHLSRDISGVVDFGMKLFYFVNRLGLACMIVAGLKNNSYHLRLIKRIRAFEKKIGSSPLKKDLNHLNRANIESFANIFINITMVMTNYIFKAIYIEFSAVLLHLIFLVLAIASNTMILYFINFFRELVKMIAEILTKYKTSNHFEFSSLTKEFFNIIPLVNSALGDIIFINIIQHVIMSALTLYCLIWLLLEGSYLEAHKVLIFTCILWLVQVFGVIILLCRVGNKLTKKIQELWEFQNIFCFSENEHQEKFLLFLKEQLLLWKFHTETRIIAAGSIEINNSGYFSVLSVITTYLIIIVQFKQMEDDLIGSH